MFLLNSRLGLFTATRLGSSREGFHLLRAVLLPKLRTQFAEFLSMVSLTRLRILSSPTCVGLRYGHPRQRTTLFSAACLGPLWVRLTVPPTVVFQPSRVADLPTTQPTDFNAHPSVRGPYAPASRLTLTPLGGTGMLTRFPSPTPFGLGLGPD